MSEQYAEADPDRVMKTKVVIAGGGFGGLYAAKYFDKTLSRRDDVEVTLISRENFILFTPMLHEIAAGDLSPNDIVNPLRRILRYVKFAEADVRAVDLNARKIPAFTELEMPILSSSTTICFSHSVPRQTSLVTRASANGQ